MKKILETKRIYLREMTEEDYEDLCDILQDTETMYAYEHGFSDDEVEEWLNKQFYRYKQFGFGLWAVIDKETQCFVGQAGLTIQCVEGKEELEIGYLLKKKYWHRGYATEAAIACRDYAFNYLDRDRVISIIRDNNYSSQQVAKRVGMTKEGEFVKQYYNIEMPHYVYVIEKNK